METLKRSAAINHDFVGWFIIAAITKKAGAIDILSGQTGDLEIKFSVNGVELPFVATLKDIEAQMDRMVKEEAVKLLDEKTGDSFEVLRDAVEAAARKLKTDLGVSDEY